MATHRGTSNTNSRGSARSRRDRKNWLLATFGDGTSAPCAFGCGVQVDFETITVDRYPVAGVDGGRYVRGNIRPACGDCNSKDGQAKGQARRPVLGTITWRGRVDVPAVLVEGRVYRNGREHARVAVGRDIAATFVPLKPVRGGRV